MLEIFLILVLGFRDSLGIDDLLRHLSLNWKIDDLTSVQMYMEIQNKLSKYAC